MLGNNYLVPLSTSKSGWGTVGYCTDGSTVNNEPIFMSIGEENHKKLSKGTKL